MAEIVVLGGYGSSGSACVRELFETTRTALVIGGRNGQRAEQMAAAIGDRARGIYVDATDLRTLRPILPRASIVVSCAGIAAMPALELAIEYRIPFVDLSPLRPDARGLDALRERAWEAQVPIVLHCGALPGLAGVLADALVRRLPEIHSLRIASTGAWSRTETARRDLAELRAGWGDALEYADGRWQRPRGRGTRQSFSDGQVLSLRPAPAPDLEHFPGAHCVERAVYLEPEPGVLGRTLEQWLGPAAGRRFCVVAEARTAPDQVEPAARIALTARDPLRAAAVCAAATVRAILEGHVPDGLLSQREAINPEAMLVALEKRDVVIQT